MFYTTVYASPIGPLTIASGGDYIVGLWIEGQKFFWGSLPESPSPRDDLPIFDQARSWLDRYFTGQRPELHELPLMPMGSPFRQEVWKCLCDIPYGEVVTYGFIAQKVAARLSRDSMSAQAVGGAVGHNPISIIIPCHRVVGTGGKLTGYSGGIDRKLWLLAHEGIDISRFE